ncbi:MAG: DUF4438 domain-containing protein [Candidatus Aminicenantes bacterium]|nr:MAG: DUF4438 domain-containing protein [Candidatus Aminicenantes bacterium]
MRKDLLIKLGILLCMAFLFANLNYAANQADLQPIKTNKDKLLTLAVQGQVAPAEPASSYATTWDGKAKMTIGIGGINYNLKIGDKVFGWASGDRATVGVATEGAGSDRARSSYLNFTSIGNEVKILSGDAKGEKGIIIGKFRSFVLVHFDDDVLELLAIGNKLHVKASGIGLKIDGFDDVFAHGIVPDVLEKIVMKTTDGKLEAPVVKEIPADLVSRGSGGSLSGHWHIQTSYPPDIQKYGLDELRFGDLVLLKDIQTDYGKGYYQGGATLGVVCSGPSDISGYGIGVTQILSTRFGKIKGRIDPSANIGKYLGITMKKPVPAPKTSALKTNKDKLITTAVQAVVQPAGSSGYRATYDGQTSARLGTASINYTVSLGDSTYGWANADHVEPDVTIQGRDQERAGACAIAILACIGNEAKVLSGEAKGAKGYYIGRHAGSDDLAWFPKDVKEKLTIDDEIQVKARGVGLQIESFEDVKVNKLSPELLENMGLKIEGNQLVVPVVMEVPGRIMGSGIGGQFVENVDYDIQTTDPQTVEEFGLKKLRLGDFVAIRDHYDYYGRGRYEGAVTIGVCIHGFSESTGHGPGLNPVLSALPGRIKTVIDPYANTVYYLGIRSRQ